MSPPLLAAIALLAFGALLVMTDSVSTQSPQASASDLVTGAADAEAVDVATAWT